MAVNWSKRIGERTIGGKKYKLYKTANSIEGKKSVMIMAKRRFKSARALKSHVYGTNEYLIYVHGKK